MLVALLALTFAMMNMEFTISSQLPNYIEANYPHLNSFHVGCIMACYPIGFLISAPILGSYSDTLGRRNVIAVGVITMTLATITYGLASYFEDD